MGNQISPFIICTFLLTILLFVSCGNRVSDSHNFSPAAPSDPSPADGAIDQVLDVQLSWQCSDPDGDDLRYDLYFGTVMDPPLIDYNLTSNNFVLGRLEEATHYYWKVLARDIRDNRTESPLWFFSTGIIPTINHVSTYSDPDGIYRFWVRDGLVYNIAISGLDIVDALGLAEPTVIGTYVPPDTGIYYSDIFIRDNYAYLSVVRWAGLHIIDISNPFNPVFVGGWSGDSSSYAAALAVEGNYVYIVAGDTALFYTIDISDPVEPILVNTYEFQWQTMLATDILVSEGLAFVVHHGRGYERYDYVTIVEISNPLNPFELDHISTNTTVCSISVHDNFLFVPYASDGFLRIFDLSQPSNPEIIGVFPSGEGIWGVFVKEEYGYLANYYSGLQIIDISDPTNPIIVIGGEIGEGAVDIFVDGEYIYYTENEDNLHVAWFVR